MYNYKERIAIFVDFDNLAGTRAGKFGLNQNKKGKWIKPAGMSEERFEELKRIPEDMWKTFNMRAIELLRDTIPAKRTHELQHVGTWFAIGKALNPSDGTKKFEAIIESFDRLHGFMMHYGIKVVESVRGSNQTKLKDKGVDTQLVCQMLIGAMHDRYDTCILFSDDQDFAPVVSIIQGHYGKRVYHAGYQRTVLRAISFGHIPMEELTHDFEYYE